MVRVYRQQGVALITVMMIVALISIVAVSMVSDQTLLIRRIQGALQANQTSFYINGVEHFSALSLKADLENNAFDDPSQKIFQATPPIPIPDTNAVIEGQLNDLQGKFNLSSLVDDTGALDPAAQGILDRLLQILGQQSLSPIISDWIDEDVQESVDGAEDTYYQTLESPYLPANRPFVSLSELRLLKGVDDESSNANPSFSGDSSEQESVYDTLIEHVAVLPTVYNGININTASTEVIQALFDIEASKASELVSTRDETPFESVDQVKSHSSLSGVDIAEIEDLILVKTHYFALEAKVTLGQVETPLYSVLRRNDDGSVNVIYRVRGNN